MATKLQQFSTNIQCNKCHKEYPISFAAVSLRAFIHECERIIQTKLCGECSGDTPKEQIAASRELQLSGLGEMYRPPNKKPSILTSEDGKKEWLKKESKTERSLRECSADAQGSRITKPERMDYPLDLLGSGPAYAAIEVAMVVARAIRDRSLDTE